MAQPLDADRLELSSDRADRRKGRFLPAQFYGLFSVSNNGTLMYLEGMGTTLALTWFDQNGKMAGVFGEPGDYANPVMSPDQSRIAVARGRGIPRHLDRRYCSWLIHSLDVRSRKRRLPVWSPDSTDIVFSSDRSGVQQIYLKPSDGSGDERLLTDKLGLPGVGPRMGASCSSQASGRRPAATSGHFPILVASLATASPSSFFRRHSRRRMRSSPPTAAGSRTLRTNHPTTCQFGRFPQTAPRARLERNGSSPGLARRRLRWHPDGKQLLYANGATSISSPSISTRARDSTPVLRDHCSGRQGRSFCQLELRAGRAALPLRDDAGRGQADAFTVMLNWAAALRK